LGARSAGAQAGTGFVAVGHDGGTAWVGTADGRTFKYEAGTWSPWPNIPLEAGNSGVCGGDAYAATANGAGYHKDYYTGDWVSFGSPEGPTPAAQTTFGALKSRYRGAVTPTTDGRSHE